MGEPPIVNGQVGTVNGGVPFTGQMPDMGGKPRKKKRGKSGEVAAVTAFKKLIKVK